MLESIRKNGKGIILMLISSICVCFGQLLWKMSYDTGLYAMILGFGLYGIGALCMIVAYRFGKVSVLQPMLSLNYVLSIVLAVLVLHEHVKWINCIGIVVIISGIFIIVGGDKE